MEKQIQETKNSLEEAEQRKREILSEKDHESPEDASKLCALSSSLDKTEDLKSRDSALRETYKSRLLALEERNARARAQRGEDEEELKGTLRELKDRLAEKASQLVAAEKEIDRVQNCSKNIF